MLEAVTAGAVVSGKKGVAQYRSVIFDFGNVFSRFDNMIFVRRLEAHTGLDAVEIHARIYDDSDLPFLLETGKISGRQFHARVCDLCQVEVGYDEFVRAFVEILEPDPLMLGLAAGLGPRFSLGLITNTNALHFEHHVKKVPVFPQFQAVVTSYQVGAMKPARALYDCCVDGLGVRYEDCVYIDDVPAYVTAAINLGMAGVVHRSYEETIDSLRSLGITAG